MNNGECLVYCIQFGLLVFGFILLEKRFKFLPLPIFFSLALLIASIFLAMLSAKTAELDSRKYMKDAVLLTSFLEQDCSLYGLFFLTGGNSIYPPSYYPMLITSNTWSNYTSYTIEKFYLFFALISKPNLYNISLFFGLLSFISKGLLLKTFYHLDHHSTKIKILWLFLMTGSLEIYFISGVYKENLLFLFLSFILYAFYSQPKIWKYIIAFICFLHALFIRIDTMIILLIMWIVFYIAQRYNHLQSKKYVIAGLITWMAVTSLYYSSYRDYAIGKLIRYGRLEKGHTHFDHINWAEGNKTLLLQILKRWLQALYSIFSHPDYLWAVNIFGAFSILSIIVLVCNQNKEWHKLTRFTTVCFVSFLFIVSLFVPNYMALLRYRSPLFVLLIFGLILNINPQSTFLKSIDRVLGRLSRGYISSKYSK